MLLGLTGGIGAGKSTALAAFARLGCPTLSSDAIVHALYRRAGGARGRGRALRPRRARRRRRGRRARRWPRASSPTTTTGAGSSSCCTRACRRRSSAGASEQEAAAPRRPARARGAAAVRGRSRRSLRRRRPDHGARTDVRRARTPAALRRARGRRSCPRPTRSRRPTTSTSTTARRPELERWVAELVARLRRGMKRFILGRLRGS